MASIKKMIKKRDIDGLIETLLNKKIEKRIEAVKALSDLNAVEGLVKALNNDNTQVRIQAISELEKNEGNDSLKAIIDTIIEEKNSDVWLAAFKVSKKILANRDWDKNEEDFWGEIAADVMKKNTIEHSLKIIERIIEINSDLETYVKIIATLNNNNFHKEALNYLEKALEIDPSDARLWIFKGEILSQLKELEESEICLKKALEIAPKSKEAYNALIKSYYLNNEDEKFFSIVKEAIQYFPENIINRILFSDKLLIHEDIERAESEIKNALDIISKKEKIDPFELSSLYEHLGIISVMKMHKNAALEYFSKAIEVNREQTWLYKLFDAYVIMLITHIARDGSPLERRARLFGLAEKRGDEIAYKTYLEYLTGDLPPLD